MESTLAKLKTVPLNYRFKGCSDGSEPPPGFNLDHHRIWLGTGRLAWNSAVEALHEWLVMPRKMVTIRGAGRIEAGQIVGVLFRSPGIWSFNPCRIIKVIDSSDADSMQYGFTYGTLPGHVEAGEEQFRLDWDQRSDQVWYEIKAVSRPNHPLAWLAYPYVRHQQQRFREQSAASMLAAVISNTQVKAPAGARP
jgi:uncharacterized protein (UPF0548 family)